MKNSIEVSIFREHSYLKNQLSWEKLEMLTIDAEMKWTYFGKLGFDNYLKIIPRSFEEILKEINEAN